MRRISIHITLGIRSSYILIMDIVIKVPIVKHNQLFFSNYLGSEIKDLFSGLEFSKVSERGILKAIAGKKKTPSQHVCVNLEILL